MRFLGVFSCLLTAGLLAACVAAPSSLPVHLRSEAYKAERGDPKALYHLASIYEQGAVVEPDLSLALQYYERSAKLGFAPAQFEMAYHLLDGIGVDVDETAGLTWLQEAADRGHARALHRLGTIYAEGTLKKQDLAWAARLWGQGAAQGHAECQYNLGRAFVEGAGVPKDLTTGLMWLMLADQRGDRDAAKLLQDYSAADYSTLHKEALWRVAAWTASKDRRYPDPPTLLFVEYALSQLGYQPGQIDGKTDNALDNAVVAYRRDAEMPVSTLISPDLVNALRVSRLSRLR